MAITRESERLAAKLETMAQHGADYNLVMSQGFPEGLDKEGASCPDCGHEADYRECDECSKAGWVIDCGHYAQPRPIAPLEHRMFCDDCFEEYENGSL